MKLTLIGLALLLVVVSDASTPPMPPGYVKPAKSPKAVQLTSKSLPMAKAASLVVIAPRYAQIVFTMPALNGEPGYVNWITYLQSSTNLTGWQAIATNTGSDPGQYSVLVTPVKHFYRLSTPMWTER